MVSHPNVVSEQLGHATIALTLDTYSHIIPSLQQEAAGVMATAILGPGATPPQRGAMAEQWRNPEPSAAGES
jgi:hypothetical protein